MIPTCYPLTTPFKWPSTGQIKVNFTVEKSQLLVWPEMVSIHLVFVCQTTAADSKRFLDARHFQKARMNYFLDISKPTLSQPNFINFLFILLAPDWTRVFPMQTPSENLGCSPTCVPSFNFIPSSNSRNPILKWVNSHFINADHYRLALQQFYLFYISIHVCSEKK